MCHVFGPTTRELGEEGLGGGGVLSDLVKLTIYFCFVFILSFLAHPRFLQLEYKIKD
jgi:hypothetical protein